MKIKHLVLTSLLFVLVLFLSGCATGMNASGWHGMTADANNVYISGGPYVYAVNLQNGTQVWRYPPKASTNPFEAKPCLTSDGQLIVGGYDKKLYSLNPQTGQSNWQFPDAQDKLNARDRWIGGVLVANDMIYAPNADYNLYALNLHGGLQWKFEADQSIWGEPVSDGTNVYFGTLGRKVYAVNAQTGKQVWMQKVDGAVLGSPVIGSDHSLYVGSYSGTVYALNTADGGTRWTKEVSSWIWSGPALDGNSLYVGDGSGKLFAFSAENGKQLWEQSVVKDEAIVGSPLIFSDMLVVGTADINLNTKQRMPGSVYLIDKTGKTIQALPMDGTYQFYASAVLAGDLALVSPSSQAGGPILKAYDKTGSLLWSFTPSK